MKVHFHQLQLSLHLFSIISPLALQMGAQPSSRVAACHPLPRLSSPASLALISLSRGPGVAAVLPPKAPSQFELLLEGDFKYFWLN